MNLKLISKGLSLAFTAFCATGCASSFKLPEVSGSSVLYSRSDTFGGTTIQAEGVQVTADQIKATSAHWVTQYPQFKIELTVKDYVQNRIKK